MTRKATLIAVGLAVLGTVFAAVSGVRFYLAKTASDRAVAEIVSPQLGGSFALVDHTGRRVTDTIFRGQFMLIFFGYTYCPDVCPTGLQIISEAMELLGPAADKVQPIFISVDHQRDTVAVLSDYVGNFHPRLLGLTGTEAQIQAAAKAYGAFYRKVSPPPVGDNATPDPGAKSNDDEDYLISHSASVHLVGPDGKYLRSFLHGTGPEIMAKGIRKYFADGKLSQVRDGASR